jgi:hypothetical protein
MVVPPIGGPAPITCTEAGVVDPGGSEALLPTSQLAQVARGAAGAPAGAAEPAGLPP